MRLFIAIPLPPDMKRAALDTQQKLIAHGATGRFVEKDNFHITMHFIGETDALSEIVDAMRAAVRDVRPFLMRMEDYGTFRGKGGNTGFIRMTGDLDELGVLHEVLEAELWERGFAKGSGRFVPHITLGRSIQKDDGFSCPRREAFQANQLVLYESAVTKGKVEYIPVHREMMR